MPYIYFIRDPLNKNKDKNINFVGVSNRPWEAVQRNVIQSANKKLLAWSKKLHKEYPQGVEILGPIVCDKFHGEDVDYPDLPNDTIRLEWGILGMDNTDDYDDMTVKAGAIISGKSLRSYWIDRLTEEGHTLVNSPLGRPTKD